MDTETLNRLMVQITYELRDFLPVNLFRPIGNTLKINDRTLTEEQARGAIASGQAENLFYMPPKNQFMSLKQRDACELLMHMGRLISIGSTDSDQSKVSANFHASLKKYFYHLSDQEAKPFVSLLESDPEQSELQAATTANKYALTDDIVTEEDLAALFDPVTVTVLEKMFPAQNSWQNWSYKAKENGLINARITRGLFNPYKAAKWFLERKIYGWDLKRCHQVLAENLPACSINKAHLLIGNKGDDKDRLKEFPLIP